MYIQDNDMDDKETRANFVNMAKLLNLKLIILAQTFLDLSKAILLKQLMDKIISLKENSK